MIRRQTARNFKMSRTTIHYYDIGDYLSREQKLEKLKQFFSVENVPWQDIAPNEKGAIG